MNPQDIRTLKLLETIEDAVDPPSQRDLARILNVSLGLVNGFIKRLVKKGYFKITHLPKNRVGYLLTPKGAAEKSRLTYAYIQYSYRFYRDARKRFKAVFRKLASEGCRRVAFYGTGELAEIGFISIQETGLRFCGIADDQAEKKSMLGQSILSIGQLKTLDIDTVVITVLDDPPSAADQLAAEDIALDKIQFL